VGQIGGKAKIIIAKDALKSVVKGWNKNSELGLMAYGHRVKGDCSDIETLVPIGKVDKGKIVNAVMSISPKGKTPISGSLKKAANELKYTEDKATIILISDGKETCDIDPCATAKELKKQGIDFVAHVIGFNVDKKTDKQLECIANATGGEYFSAKNAKELNSAVKEVAKKVEAPKPKPVVKKPKYSLKLSASESEGGASVKATHLIFKYDEDNDNHEGEQVTNCGSSKERKCKLKIPVGKYVVYTEYNEFKKYTPIEIVAGKTLEKNIVMKQDEPAKEDLIKADSQANVDVVQKQPEQHAKKIEEKKSVATNIESASKPVDSSLTVVEKKAQKSLDAKDISVLVGATTSAKAGVQNKLLQAYKASINKTLPYMQKLPECYSGANTLQEATKCDNFANKGLEVAAKAMSDVMGIAPKKQKPIAHSNWSEETKQKVYKQSLKDLKNAKLTLSCIDAGASLSGLQKCVKSGGKVVKNSNGME